MSKLLIYCGFIVVWCEFLNCEIYNTRPKIKSSNGNLVLQPAYDKNIYLNTNGPKSTIFLGDVNYKGLYNVTIGNTNFNPSISDDNVNNNTIPSDDILRRIQNLESLTNSLSSNLYLNISRYARRVQHMNTKVRYLQNLPNKREECRSHPCANGGTCLDLISGYYCICPSNWKGPNCDEDINECYNYAGTDLGCQNGATCLNKPGSYECICKPGWYGIDCTRTEKNCSQGDFEMCGHGICVPSTSGEGIRCICNQGWTTDGKGVACLTDVNECESSQKARCSVNPRVDCVNLPGSFRCGPCPTGYEGDGFACYDIDECLTLNGGCSTSPMVLCYNTIGSRICGSCPPGYQGDGVTCTWSGSCSMNRGGCHPSAECVENSAVSGMTQCVCSSGMVGDGIGLHGCYVAADVNSTNNCESNPCGPHGHCHQLSQGYSCICYQGYGGAHCDKPINFCTNNPCHNGGTCRLDERSPKRYRCECTALYLGDLCQVHSQPCGGVLDSEEGSIVYPLSNTTYADNARCAWVIHTAPDKVINVTFTKFNLEEHSSCNYDFVQIHDGRSSASQLIGRFCGTNFPNGGNIISSHNNLYFWFRSDHSVAKEGFSLHWTSVAPVCGGEIDASVHGHISSPGSPGTYPPNRDCYWHLLATLGKRIQLHFFELDIESHRNCSFDYLAIYDGEHTTDPLLNKYCNSTQPAPVQSTGSEILIHFHSDKLGNGKGFQISFAPIEGVPGCGGLFTTDKGEITSPSYNNAYLPNLLCEYKIKTRRHTKIRIEFNFFHLERSLRCKYDYLRIFDGHSADSRLVGTFCDTRHPKTFISTTNDLFIIFRSDHNIASEGFKISYESICEFFFTQDSGAITSPEYPANYPKQTSCDYIISTTPGKAITLMFQDFDIENNRYNYNCQYDYVEVRDGPSINSTLMGRYCGSSESTPPIQTSSHNFMFIRFKSDVSISGRGFYANYTTVDTECGGIYKNSSGVVNHPSNVDGIYSNNQYCTWMLIAPEGMHIKLEWSKFEVEDMPTCNSDYVEIVEYDENNYNTTLGKYCGRTFPPAITTYSNRISIIFKSDISMRLGGFSLSYTFLDEKTYCGGLFVKSHGFIYSPGWPLNYEANRDCAWTITVPQGQQIMLNITNLELERPYNEKCDDYIAIWDGSTEKSDLIGQFCGYIKSKRIITTANNVHLKFHSDAYISRRGFKIEWDGTLTGCGGTLSGASGVISSPNYPQNYNANAECFYRIVTSTGTRIRISFSVLDLERTQYCKDDYVEIFDGRDSNSVSFGKHCYLSPKLNNVETSSNHAFIKFRSDIFNTGKGFLLNYNTICNNNVSGRYGAIESPGFPNKYPVDSDCLWTITVPKGNKINATFTHFDILNPQFSAWPPYRYSMLTLSLSGCFSSYLQFKELSEEKYSDKQCGPTFPRSITTKSNSLQIRFVTGHNYPRNGFRLEWISFGCGGHIQKQSGVVSMDKNMLLAGEMECEWIIETPVGTAVTITFSEVYMTAAKNCSIDALEIYNGQSKDFPLLSKICNRGQTSLQATSNFLLIRLVKLSPIRDVYFMSHFDSNPVTCGGKINAPFGLIHSKNYPMNYDNNLDCVWTLSVPKYHRIEINFISFDLYYTGGEDDEDDCGDSIKIYDGFDSFSSNYTLLICPKSNITHPIISNHSTVKLQFTSDLYGSAKGFKANFTMTCGAVITANSDGVISNDNFISHHKTNCTWVIKAPNLEDKLKLTISHISIPKSTDIITNRQCHSSYLKVFDGDDETAPLIEEFCGRKVPPAIISQGSTMTIQLGTYTDTLSGQFSAHYSTLTSSCGGHLSSEEGAIASPNYPRSYPSNADCEWILSTAPGNRVYITFENFDLGYSENCNEDYLEIRENDGGGQLLAVYCGHDIPINTTTGSKLYLKFHSDNKNAGQGFLLHYGFLHGNEITGFKSGEIASPLYPSPYEGQGEYTWRIMTSSSTTITLNIDRLELIRNGDVCNNKLTIYDGYDVNAPIIRELCGYLADEIQDLQSTSNVVYIMLTLDATNIGAIFFIRWAESSRSIGDSSPISKFNCGSRNHTLAQFISPENNSIEFYSPNYPNTYNNNLNCEWIFSTIASRHLSLSFNDILLEQTSGCFADYISIFSLIRDKWTPIKEKICLAENEKIKFESTTMLKVTFVTDSYETRKGFKGIVSSVCGGTLDKEKSGVIEITQVDFKLTHTIRCNWTVKVRPGRRIQLDFIHFNITNDNDCTTYLILRNGENVESPLLGTGKFCGYSHENRTSSTSSSNAVYISYVAAVPLDIISSRKLQYFKLLYKEENIECGFSSTLTDDHKWEIITSPNYPSIPIPYTECIWTFTGPPGEILRIDFMGYFKLETSDECISESIEIRDGISELSPLKKRLCKEQPETIKTTNNAMYIKYSTQVAEPKNGFKANVSIDVCGGTIVAKSGEISSPGYPHILVMPWGTICKWHIISIPRHTIRIYLKDTKLPESEKPCETKLTFEELVPSNGTYENVIIKQFCDDDFIDYSQSFETITNNLTVKFQLGKPSQWTEVSDSRGFRFNFNSSRNTCGGTIKASEGYLTSPGYPRETSLRYCQWSIELPDVTRRVQIELLDYDRSDIIGAFNDLTYACPIALINQNISSETIQVFKSTAHRLLLYVAIGIRNKQTHRFNAKFSSDEPALCGGDLNGIQGELKSPDLQENFICEWRYSNTETYVDTKYKYNTISVNIKITSSNSNICRISDSQLTINAAVVAGEVSFIRNACGNNTEVTFSIPASNMNIKASQFKIRPLRFNLSWNLNPCGGIVYAKEDVVNVIDVPEALNKTIDCAWIIIAPVGVRVELKLEGTFNLDCSDESLKIYKGLSQIFNDIGNYCKSKSQEKPLIVGFKHIYVRYYSKLFNKNNVKLLVKTVTAQCGGYLTHYDRSFTSPNYPHNYLNNEECVWEIQAETGYRISLHFTNRFVIEDTKNCSKDAIIIYDFKENEFSEMSKICGRIIPPAFNSTSNQMKVVFRTDANITLDGFKAEWNPICGGTYEAKDKEQFLYSPGYFSEYDHSLDCTYEIKSKPDSKIIIKFIDFDLEGSYPECEYDNVTINYKSYYSADLRIYCGKEMPPTVKSLNDAIIAFKTDRYINKRGFKLSYALFNCGGTIKEPTILAPEISQLYVDDTNCTWLIEAPQNKVVTMKFIYIDLESSFECFAESLAVYDGPFIDDEKRLALMCGRVNSTTYIKGKSNKMVLQFTSNSNAKDDYFQVAILFTYSELVGCGGTINLTESRVNVKSPLIGNSFVYENYLDCRWVIKSPVDHVIKVEFTAFHIASCPGVNQTAIGVRKCECDYVELIDGDNPNSLVIDTYCGHNLPPQIMSSNNIMTIKLFTDGELASSGFEAVLSSIPSVCGQSTYKISTQVQTLKSPGYDTGLLPRNLYCSYHLDASSEPYSTIHIRIKNLDLEPGSDNICSKDKLLIYSHTVPLNESLGKKYILNDGLSDFLARASNYYDTAISYPKRFELCGVKKSIDYYVTGSSNINIQTTGETTPVHRGFEIEISYVGICGRNYTELQARIQAQTIFGNDDSSKDCYTLITVPENYTISIYFISITRAYWAEDPYLEIFDGNTTSAHSLIKINNNYNTDYYPIMSTQRYMLLHNHIFPGRQAITYDLNYVATNKSRGCGGQFFSDSGQFTSPFYPNEYRRTSTCEWEIETPVGTRVMLRFIVFDLGVICDQNYLSIIDRSQNTISTFCSEYPANYISDDNYVKIAFTTTMNNGGTGWVIEYISVL
ncbi:unnamed protein product, partial [Brenthis ino]